MSMIQKARSTGSSPKWMFILCVNVCFWVYLQTSLRVPVVGGGTESSSVPVQQQPVATNDNLLAARIQQETISSRKELQGLVNKELPRWRPEAWEDDISRNTLDTKPFVNLPPITERPESEFRNKALFLPDNLLQDQELKELVARDPYPIPRPEDREGYSPGYDGNYWMFGLADYLKILAAAERHGVVKIKSFYEFGCASGRVLRHFATHTPEITEIWGSDLNARHIRWLQEFLPPQVKPIFNSGIPSLPIPDSSVDIISAFSVFTHIDTFETQWLAELARIVKPDGLLYITVHNEDTWEALRDVDHAQNSQIKTLIKADPNFLESLKGPMPDTRTVYQHTKLGPYRGQVFLSNNYLRMVWSRFFDILEILPREHARQTVLVMRKK